MYKHALRALVLVASAFAPLAGAQHGTHGAQPPASPPARPVGTQPSYESAFADYRPYREEPAASWRQVNDEVARVGGHAGVLKAEPAPGAAPARDPSTVSPATPAPARSGGHHGKH